jgi:hypothetical protein
MAKPNYRSFDDAALKGIAQAIGLNIPPKTTHEELADMISVAEQQLGEAKFQSIIAPLMATSPQSSGAPRANVLPGAGVKEVTFPRRNTDAGRASYSIKSETHDPRTYVESAGHVPSP